mgnify:CR=1 FL=1
MHHIYIKKYLTTYIFIPGGYWRKIGCFKDNKYSRALPFYLAVIDLDYDTTYPDLKKFFQVCRKLAERHGFYYFGIQAHYECWAGYKRTRYDEYGSSNDCRVGNDGYGVGFESANFVYGRAQAGLIFRLLGHFQSTRIISII